MYRSEVRRSTGMGHGFQCVYRIEIGNRSTVGAIGVGVFLESEHTGQVSSVIFGTVFQSSIIVGGQAHTVRRITDT